MLGFYLLYPLLYLLSLMPLGFLYFISDYLLYPVLYKLLKYRIKVVKSNLLRIFPDKSDAERLDIERKFYHYLCDLFMETVKGFTISPEELNKRIEFVNIDLLTEYYKLTNGAVLSLGHVGNYEWLAQSPEICSKVQLAIPYRKLTNPYFDNVFKKSRERGGANLFHTQATRHYIVKHKKGFGLTLVNDQSSPAENSYWTKFFNNDTSFYVGTEKTARGLNFSVVFLEVERPRRGYYKATFKPITKNPNEEKDGYILDKHVEYLEENILKCPECWLWSHKRWKHKKPDGLDSGFSSSLKKA